MIWLQHLNIVQPLAFYFRLILGLNLSGKIGYSYNRWNLFTAVSELQILSVSYMGTCNLVAKRTEKGLCVLTLFTFIYIHKHIYILLHTFAFIYILTYNYYNIIVVDSRYFLNKRIGLRCDLTARFGIIPHLILDIIKWSKRLFF